jgi:branched-chain amino acid transport system permease protein
VFSSLSGYVSLGHVVFYGLGAYVMVATWNQISVPLAIGAAALAAGAFAALVGFPVLRVRGPYFVILTFGVAELVKFIVLAVEAKLGHASRMLLGAPALDTLYFWMLGLAIIATLIAYAVRSSRLGRGLRAIRENEEAAETIGVPIARYKLFALVLSALVPGAVGAVMALRTTYFEPILAFDPMISFTMIAMTIIGGSDALRGPFLGALFLLILQELLWTNAPQLYMILLGLLLIAFVLFLPSGLSGGLERLQRWKLQRWKQRST